MFSRNYTLIKGFNIIVTPDLRYQLNLEEFISMDLLSQANFNLKCLDNMYEERIQIMKLFEPILPQKEVYSVEANLINDDDNLALKVLYDPRITI